jgi:hypothetical protein
VNTNRERLYRPKKGDTLLEFPLDYTASAYLPQGQNAKGHAKMSNGPARDPGIARAITNQRGAIQGVNYHPEGDMARGMYERQKYAMAKSDDFRGVYNRMWYFSCSVPSDSSTKARPSAIESSLLWYVITLCAYLTN